MGHLISADLMDDEVPGVAGEQATDDFLTNPAELSAHRDALYRFALLSLRNPNDAEDVVQATLLAAVQARDAFRGGCTPRTWLVGILKRKIIDAYRARQQDEAVPEAAGDEATESDDADWLDALFARNGAWVVRPQSWDDPDQSLQRQEFFQVLELCLKAVPGVAGRAFLLREVMDLEPDEICKDLRISKSNYWVLMHRARLRLRGCLDKNWFAGLRRS